MTPKFRLLIALLLAATLFSAPTTSHADDSTPIIEACPAGGATDAIPGENAKKVLTTFTVLADMARNVACGLLDIQSITRIGSEIHGYEPTPSDVARTQDADLVFYNGFNLERWFERFMGAVGSDVPVVLLTEGIEPVNISEGSYTDLPNPHAWMSPANALIYVANIRDAFIALDPANEAAYTANAEAYSQQIAQIDQFLRQNLAKVPAEQRYFVSCEGAYSYFTRDYGMIELYMWPINSDQNGSPKQMAKVIDSVRKNNIPVVFCESTVNQKPMQEVARQTGARYGGYLYVDSITEADGEAPTYLDLLKFDAAAIVNGLLNITQ
jgi:ABC-type Zn uptake system ZnuABC Zn-binding protein ZnuA